MLHKLLNEMQSRDSIHLSLLAKKTDVTYAHIINIINKIESEGLVISIHQGRNRELKITPKGMKAYEKLSLYFQEFSYLH